MSNEGSIPPENLGGVPGGGPQFDESIVPLAGALEGLANINGINKGDKAFNDDEYEINRVRMGRGVALQRFLNNSRNHVNKKATELSRRIKGMTSSEATDALAELGVEISGYISELKEADQNVANMLEIHWNQIAGRMEEVIRKKNNEEIQQSIKDLLFEETNQRREEIRLAGLDYLDEDDVKKAHEFYQYYRTAVERGVMAEVITPQQGVKMYEEMAEYALTEMILNTARNREGDFMFRAQLADMVAGDKELAKWAGQDVLERIRDRLIDMNRRDRATQRSGRERAQKQAEDLSRKRVTEATMKAVMETDPENLDLTQVSDADADFIRGLAGQRFAFKSSVGSYEGFVNLYKTDPDGPLELYRYLLISRSDFTENEAAALSAVATNETYAGESIRAKLDAAMDRIDSTVDTILKSGKESSITKGGYYQFEIVKVVNWRRKTLHSAVQAILGLNPEGDKTWDQIIQEAIDKDLSDMFPRDPGAQQEGGQE